MKRWTQIFKVLANTSRLKILVLLSDGEARNVSDIAREIHVTFKATSRHLGLLYNLDLLTNDGRDGHVFYGFNQNMPKDARQVVDIFIKRNKTS